MPWRRLNSLRSRLMLLVALAITPIAVVTVLGGLREREAAIRASEEDLQRLAGLAAANEAQSIDRARQILIDLASVPATFADADTCNALMADILERNEGYANLGMILPSGDVGCSAVPLDYRVNLADRDHFRRSIDERRFFAGGYVFGRVIRKHTINMNYPVFDRNDRLRGVVFASVDLTALDTFVDEVSLPQDAIMETSDAAGRLISRRPNPERWYGKQVAPELLAAMRRPHGRAVTIRDPDGVERLHAFARVGPASLTDYVVTISVPTASVTRVAREAQWISLIGLAATTLLALAFAWLAGDKLIVQRVRRLMMVARSIAAGNLEARSGLSHHAEELGQLAGALDEMAEDLQKKEQARSRAERDLRAADQRKDEFLAMLAHELRNPLAPISTGAQLLKLLHSDDAQITQTCAIIARQVEHMTSLVDDLLDVSRVTRGLVTLSRSALDLRKVIDDAVEQIRPLANARHHTLLLELPGTPVPAMGDHKRLVQVVANLLGNAAKYTPEHGHIRLRLWHDATEHILDVSDDGIGMAPALVERVFDLFAQAERTPDRSQGGLGLGLALVRSLVELHGGSVAASSGGPGQGSCFTVRLPRTPVTLAATSTTTTAPSEPPAGRALRVMIVDDNHDAAHTLKLFLQAAGHEVDVAYSAAEALALVRQHALDACVLDIGLPDMDGNALARQLRALPATRGALLVAATGYGQQQDRAQAREAGFDHYLVKPVDTAQLAAMLSNTLQHR